MTQQETYNAICEKMNELLPSRLELKFGCEIKVLHENGNPLPIHIVLGRNDNRTIRTETYGELNEQDIKILGTPVTLQEILRALRNVGNGIFANGADGTELGKGNFLVINDECWYDLTLPVSEQSQEMLEWILLTISGKDV